MIIGLSGYARSGKDTVAEILGQHGFERRAFADTLRNMLYALNPYIGPFRTQEVVDSMGWEAAKVHYPELRVLLQRLGTEAGRDILGDNIWVDTTLSKLGVGDFVLTDCRFQNEANAVKAAGGQVWRVVRPGCGPVNGHISEIAMDDYPHDAYIHNDGDLTDLVVLVNSLMVSV
jgi:hypothetical protein